MAAKHLVAVALLATAGGCGLSLQGALWLESDDADVSSHGSSSGTADSSLSGEDPTADGSGVDGAGPLSEFDAHGGNGDLGPTVFFPDAGPSHGTMACPPGGDAAVCDLGSNVCCTCPNCFAPYPTECFPTLTGCVGVVFSGTYARLTCGGSNNCDTGQVCCAEFDSASVLTGSACLAACPSPGSVQLCTPGDACGAGTTCQPLASVQGFSACQ